MDDGYTEGGATFTSQFDVGAELIDSYSNVNVVGSTITARAPYDVVDGYIVVLYGIIFSS